tara:strand:- start:737 stop:967 length:231 start_codon:yes stop_codon:yes gene_type:complete
MASIDTIKLSWDPESDKNKAQELSEGIEHVILEDESKAVQEIFDKINELSEKVNVIYDLCITNFNVKSSDNPYHKK